MSKIGILDHTGSRRSKPWHPFWKKAKYAAEERAFGGLYSGNLKSAIRRVRLCHARVGHNRPQKPDERSAQESEGR